MGYGPTFLMHMADASLNVVHMADASLNSVRTADML